MAFTGNFMCTSFKVEILKAVHNFTLSTGNTFRCAMYTNSASFTAATTAYTSANEVTGTGYVAKGNSLTNVTPVAQAPRPLLILVILRGVPLLLQQEGR